MGKKLIEVAPFLPLDAPSSADAPPHQPTPPTRGDPSPCPPTTNPHRPPKTPHRNEPPPHQPHQICCSQEVPPHMARMTVVTNSILPCQEAFPVDAPTPLRPPLRWIQAKRPHHRHHRHRPANGRQPATQTALKSVVRATGALTETPACAVRVPLFQRSVRAERRLSAHPRVARYT